ncbi:MAG TPA: hypothetical protein VFO46_16145 [Candidatus Sulfotelmatobacter sp.]|nr:hypothetical protein [Candidatus Sulfotelmatobacter sp.]
MSRDGVRCSTVNCCALQMRGFELLLTTDKNLAYQQNLTGRKIAIVVLGKSRWTLIKPVLGRIAEAVKAAKPGSYTIVDIPAV